jgi:copper chaperone
LPPKEYTVMNATSKTTTLRSNDLSCPSCVAKIERELRRVDGVGDATVHFTTGRIVVEHDPVQAKIEDLIGAVNRAGYTAKATGI